MWRPGATLDLSNSASTDHTDLVVRRPEGLYCPAGDFYIDPMRRVERAVITHAHADHARTGHRHYLAQADGAGVLRQRLGQGIALQTLAYGEDLRIGDVTLSLHPAGHVLGSSQVRLAHRGQVWVVSGDYFLSPTGDRNPTCQAFEPVPCHCFITESTFALPVYRWPAHARVFDQIHAWWQANQAEGRPSVVAAYSLGKAQRLLASLDANMGPLVVHATIPPLNAAYAEAGVPLPPVQTLTSASEADLRRALVIAPPNVKQSGSAAMREARTAFASGWMQVAKRRRQPGMDRGFVLSDHADWPGLLMAITATGAERVIVHHGDEGPLVRHLRSLGLQAGPFEASSSTSRITDTI